MAKKSKKTAKTYAALIMDRSGSMVSIRQEALDAFNAQVRALKDGTATGMKTLVSQVFFSTTVDNPLSWCADVDTLKEATLDEYRPEGFTALYDAIGVTAHKLSQLPDAGDADTAFLVVVVTDGQENQSREYNVRSIGNLVRELQATGRWTFAVQGANLDLAALATVTGIPVANMDKFDASHTGTMSASVRTQSAAASYMSTRGAGGQSVSNFYAVSPKSTPPDSDDGSFWKK